MRIRVVVCLPIECYIILSHMRALFCVSCADVFETYFAKYGVLIHRLCKLKLLRRFPGLAFYFFLSLLQITVRMRGILEKLLVEILRNP